MLIKLNTLFYTFLMSLVLCSSTTYSASLLRHSIFDPLAYEPSERWPLGPLPSPDAPEAQKNLWLGFFAGGSAVLLVAVFKAMTATTNPAVALTCSVPLLYLVPELSNGSNYLAHTVVKKKAEREEKRAIALRA